jgi:hypothetical protein
MLPPTLSRAEFVANPTNSTATAQDPYYNTYQNLGSGFSIKYLKNMTVSEKTDNSSAFRIVHSINFANPHKGTPNFKGIPHILRTSILVTTATGILGLPTTLDEITKQVLLASANNSTTITGKTKGSLNGFPAYKIEVESTVNPVNYTGTTTKIPTHSILYFTVKDQLLYDIGFTTSDKNIQTNFVPMANKLIGTFKYNWFSERKGE